MAARHLLAGWLATAGASAIVLGLSPAAHAATAAAADASGSSTGANNVEMGLGVPVKVNSVISLYAYGAYSYQWYGLVGTQPSTFWGGAKVTFSF